MTIHNRPPATMLYPLASVSDIRLKRHTAEMRYPVALISCVRIKRPPSSDAVSRSHAPNVRFSVVLLRSTKFNSS